MCLVNPQRSSLRMTYYSLEDRLFVAHKTQWPSVDMDFFQTKRRRLSSLAPADWVVLFLNIFQWITGCEFSEI